MVNGRSAEKAPDQIQWHPGFYGAAELELRTNVSELKFQTEVELSKKPLRVDLLIVKVAQGAKIQNEVGRIFKGYNIIEYKSPEDGLSIDDFFKTLGYACLYKGLGTSVDQFPESEITVSLFRNTYPKKLFRTLAKSGRSIQKKYPGIYYVSGNLPFATQIVVTDQLDHKIHSAFRVLSAHASEADIRRFIEQADRYTEPGDRNNADAVLRVSIAANKELYEKMRRKSQMSDALEWLMRDVIEAREKKAAEKAAEQAAAQTRQETSLINIKALMETMNLTATQAMDALKIPDVERAVFAKKL